MIKPEITLMYPKPLPFQIVNLYYPFSVIMSLEDVHLQPLMVRNLTLIYLPPSQFLNCLVALLRIGCKMLERWLSTVGE